MQTLAVNFPPVQPPSCRAWTPARRAKAEAHVQRFLLELGTDPKLPSVSARTLRALYGLHLDRRVAADFLLFVQSRRWNSDTTRKAVRAFLKVTVVRRCRGEAGYCWLHNAIALHDLTHIGRHSEPTAAA